MIKKIIFLFLISILTIGRLEAMEALTRRQEQIVRISALLSVGNWTELKAALEQGLEEGLTQNEIKELLVHLYAYNGFPRSLSGINNFLEVMQERKANGVVDLEGEIATNISSDADKYTQGKQVVETLFGPEESKAPYAEAVPVIDVFLKEHLFADIFGRGVLSYKDRELSTISSLVAQGNVQSMLKSHMIGGMNVGLTEHQVQQVIDIVESELGVEKARQGRIVLNEIMQRKSEGTFLLDIDTTFIQGQENPYSQYFTGKTYLTMLSEKDDVWNAPIGNVVFEPQARTNWHKHSGGQILLVTEGIGYYQEKGQKARRLVKGDVVRIPPDVEHWHGAGPDSWFVHISIETNGAYNKAAWLDSVTQAEYNQAIREE